jgi:hypothetical protein
MPHTHGLMPGLPPDVKAEAQQQVAILNVLPL